MPFPYETSATPVRVRRSKDKDSRSTASSSSGRKQKRSGSSNRSPPQADRSSQLSLYTQQNLTLDQLPALPESGTASPGSAASPVLRESACATTQAIESASVARHYTPAALQKYLQIDDDQPSHKAASQPGIDDQEHTRRLRSGADRPQIYSQPLDSHTSTPLATSVREYPDTSHDRSASPSFFNQPLEFYASNSSRTSSSRAEENYSYTVSSPPPSSSSPSVGRSASVQGFLDLKQPQPQSHVGYLASPPAFAPAIPFNSAPPGEQYFAPPYAGPHYYPMTHPAGQYMDLHSLSPQNVPPYANYGASLHNPGFFSPLHHNPARGHSSTSSRMSATGEPFPTAQPASGPMEKTSSLDSPGEPKQEGEDDAVDLLQRIQSAIPDLHLLLNRYRETSGKLGMRENLIKETEAQKSAALKQKEAYIDKLGKELDDVKSKYSAESSKLRFEISNMEEKQKELRDIVSVEQKSKEELQAKNHALLIESERMRNKFEEERSRIVSDFEAWKRKASEDKKSLEEDLQRQKQLADTTLQARLADIGKVHAQQKESLQTSLARQIKDLEANHAKARQELEKALDARQKVAEESRRNHAEDKESWEKERAVLGKGSEEQRRILTSRHQSEKNDMQKSQEVSEARIRKQAQDDMAKLHDQIEGLKAGWDADKGKFARSTADLKAQAARVDEENKRLQRLAEAFGEVTDLRSRGDPFYHDAFKHLERQITDVAMEHFKDTPEDLPGKATQSIPLGLPPFFSNTESSSHLRMAFVEHTVSTVITRRIFEPFLFVLSGRLRSADELFVEMSQNLKHKSTRREALWRQRTLHAAYTASSAKQSINRTATTIVDEIVGAIKHLVDRSRWHHVTAAVRRIVKTAAETWRYARLESPLIIATMNGDEIARVSYGHAAESNRPRNTGRKILLSLFPLVRREAAYGSLQDESKMEDKGYVYSPGRVLYADDPDVLACQAETQAGQAARDATPSPTNVCASTEPQFPKASRPQSPLVPVKLPAMMPPGDREWSDPLRDEHSDTGEKHQENGEPPSVAQDHNATMRPEEREVVSNLSGTSSDRSSITTMASDETPHSASKPASIPGWGSRGASAPAPTADEEGW